MTQKDKELLLKELCARLPYRTMVKCNTDKRHEFDEELSVMHIMNFYQFEVRPYLRPMSSISDLISAKEWSNLGGIELIDWYNANHIDYRGLIEKGIAIEAPEGMYE